VPTCRCRFRNFPPVHKPARLPSTNIARAAMAETQQGRIRAPRWSTVSTSLRIMVTRPSGARPSREFKRITGITATCRESAHRRASCAPSFATCANCNRQIIYADEVAPPNLANPSNPSAAICVRESMLDHCSMFWLMSRHSLSRSRPGSETTQFGTESIDRQQRDSLAPAFQIV
jgi:hypothetical protein